SYAVAAARLATATDDPGERAVYLAKLDEIVERVMPYAELAPGNFSCYGSLVQAERARAHGDADTAVLQYLATIDHASTHGYVLMEAFANELLGRLHAEHGRRFSLGYFREAWALYLQCGARAKALQLEDELPDLAEAPARGRF